MHVQNLEPQNKIGAPAQRIEDQLVEVADRAELHREIARENGDRIIAKPDLALDAITHQQSTFTKRDLARFAHRHSDGMDQFYEVMEAMSQSPNMVELGKDAQGLERFTTRQIIEVEQRLHHAGELMAGKELHDVSKRSQKAALVRAEQRGLTLFGEQAEALGTFPAQIKISIHGASWHESEINDWISDPQGWRPPVPGNE